MPKNKNAYIRYRIIDGCLRNKQKPFPNKEELIAACEVIGSVSLRTIEQDIYDMQHDEELGYFAPISFDRKRKGYGYTDPYYSISKFPLRENDLYALDFVFSLLKQFEGIGPVQQYRETLDKIEELINIRSVFGEEPSEQFVEVEKGLSAAGNEFLNDLMLAIKERRTISLTYKRFGNDAAKTYAFNAYVLKEYRNRWYVTGRNSGTDRIVTFALERITGLQLTDTYFKKDPDFSAKEYFKYSFGISVNNDFKPLKVLLKFDPEQAPFIRSQPWHQSQQILVDTQNEFRIELTVIPSYELKAQVLSYGATVEVLKPSYLRKEIQDELRKAAGRYT
jgi:predicted DNA-binding transcriptional regulator YafY